MRGGRASRSARELASLDCEHRRHRRRGRAGPLRSWSSSCGQIRLTRHSPAMFAIVPPPAQPLNLQGDARDIALSPNGRHLVYRSGGSMKGGSPLMLRAIDELDARPLAGIDGALAPFFSPDSQWIGFFAGGELRKVSIRGGPVVTICPVTGMSRGATWGDDDTIIFATSDEKSGLWRVSAAGGSPTALTTPDAAQRETRHSFPFILPGSRGVLFTTTGVVRRGGYVAGGGARPEDWRSEGTGSWRERCHVRRDRTPPLRRQRVRCTPCGLTRCVWKPRAIPCRSSNAS